MPSLVPLLVALVVAVACVGIGRLARGGARNLPLDFLVGYPMLGAVCFVVGLVKVNVWTMLGSAAVSAAAAAASRRRRAGGTPARQPAGTPALRSFGLLFVIVVLLCALVAAPSPEHLAVAHTWVLEGRAVQLPLLAQSHRPLGIESASLPALALLGPSGGGVASHSLHWLAAIAATWLIARRTQSWLLTAAIVTTPALALHLPDWPLLGLFVAMLDDEEPSAATAAGLLTSLTFVPFAALVWIVRRKRPRWIVLAGLLFYLRAIPRFATGERELALADFIFDPRWMQESLGAALVTLPAFASGAVAIGSASIAIALFFLGPSARVLVPYLAVASMSASVKNRWLAAVVVISVVLQTAIVVSLTGRAPRAAHSAVAWLNQTLPRDSRTLVIGTSETYWLTRPARAGEAPRLSRYLDVPAPEALKARLQDDGITHVAVVTARRNEERQVLSPAAQRMLAVTLDRYAANVTSRGDVTLFELR
ncbi:MAG TPA: hypothetical protein VF266_27200 [Thermoanaerobaculia bacterium]